MALSQVQRGAVIQWLTTNCDCWKNPGDHEVLGNLTDDKLVQLKDAAVREAQAITVANSAARGWVDQKTGNAFRVNPETGQWERAAVPTGNADDEGDYKKKFMKDDDEEDDDDDEEEPKTNRRRKANNRKAASTPAPERPRTLEQQINALPPELRETIKVARDVERREKDQVIGNILANSAVSESDKRAHYDWLSTKPLAELNNMLALMPKAPTNEEMARIVPRPASGRRGGGQTRNSGGINDDILHLPKIDWEQAAGKTPTQNGGGSGGSGGGGSVANAGDEDYQEDDNDISSLPPRWRATVQNALAVEERERNTLIDQLVENVADEAAERRLRSTFERKPLEELRSLLALAPKKPAPQVNYFGNSPAAPALNAQNTRIPDLSDDLLLPPKVDWAAAARGSN